MGDPEGVAGALVDLCRARVGDALRTVTIYDDEGFDRTYVRENVAAGYSRARFAALVANARDVHPSLRNLPRDDDAPIGAFEGTIHRFGRADVIQLATTDDRGYLVSVDRGSDDPVALLAACREAV